MLISEVRELIFEVFLEDIPSKDDIERQIDSAGTDKIAISRVLSLLMRKFPPSSKLLIQALGRSIIFWRGGKTSHNEVARALDSLYASLEKKKSSYASSYPPTRNSNKYSKIA